MEKNMKNKSILFIIILLLGLIIINSCKDITDPDSKSIKSQSSKRELKKLDTAYSFIPASGKTLWLFIPNSISRYSWNDQIIDCGSRWITAWSGLTSSGMPPANPSFYGNEYQTAYDAFNGTDYTPQIVMRLYGNAVLPNYSEDLYDNYNFAWMEKMIEHFNSNTGVIGWQVNEPLDIITWVYLEKIGHHPPTAEDRVYIDTAYYRLVRLANKAYPNKLFIHTGHKPSFGVAWYNTDTQNGTYRYWYQRLLDTCSNVEIWPEAYGKQWNHNGYWNSGADVTQDFFDSYNSYTGRMGFCINVDESPSYTQDPDYNTEYNWNHVLNFMNQHGIPKVGIWGCNVTGATVNKFCDAAKYYNFLQYNP
jgi:hypothetical protein